MSVLILDHHTVSIKVKAAWNLDGNEMKHPHKVEDTGLCSDH